LQPGNALSVIKTLDFSQIPEKTLGKVLCFHKTMRKFDRSQRVLPLQGDLAFADTVPRAALRSARAALRFALG